MLGDISGSLNKSCANYRPPSQLDELKIESVPEKLKRDESLERAYGYTEMIVQVFLSWAFAEEIYVGCITYMYI